MTKLKTLKDIDCVHCNDKCDGFKCDAYTLHTEHAIDTAKLKQEIIKYLKDFENGWKRCQKRINTHGITRQKIREERMKQYADEIVMSFIMDFFDLKEEDLQ